MARQNDRRARRAPREREVRPPYGTDLYAFAGLLGESFRARVDLLAGILGTAHHPSVGTYKENLLADQMRSLIPQRFAVGTGFVLFPAAGDTEVTGPRHDPMRYNVFVLSHQCDIIVYDTATVPVVFRDGPFAIVRPESVRAVIEVTGSLTRGKLSKVIERAADFCAKWAAWADAHVKGGLGGKVQRPRAPMLAALAWRAEGTAGRPRPDGREAREAIAARFAPLWDPRMPLPLLEQLAVYDEYLVAQSVDFFDDGDPKSGIIARYGWRTLHGRWLKQEANGTNVRREDKTIASLLATVLARLEDTQLSGFPTGRYLGTPWRVRDEDIEPHACAGATYCDEVNVAGVRKRPARRGKNRPGRKKSKVP